MVSLYIHIPWCVRKCPYCDFNSYPQDSAFQETERRYVEALLRDLEQDLHAVNCASKPQLHSIFIGGGTPSLFSLESIAKILSQVQDKFVCAKDIEATMEVNPGTVDAEYLAGIRALGINRLSIGVQSFQDDKLRALGRIHDAKTAVQAVTDAHTAGFENINLDLIFGLPQQNIKDAIYDLQNAIALAPTHISWYQLAIETGSEFYKRLPPNLPGMDEIWEMQRAGQEYLQQHNYIQYEVSAYSKPNYQCQHNLNYWLFGDYIGIGAGAHGKITCRDADKEQLTVHRKCKFALPEKYLQGLVNGNFTAEQEVVPTARLPFEFMLNALRLYRSLPLALFTERTGLDRSIIASQLAIAEQRELLKVVNDDIITTSSGRNFLNDLTEIFI